MLRIKTNYFWRGMKSTIDQVKKLICEFLDKVSPFPLAPVLIDSNLVISESLAIIEYLEEKYPKL